MCLQSKLSYVIIMYYLNKFNFNFLLSHILLSHILLSHILLSHILYSEYYNPYMKLYYIMHVDLPLAIRTVTINKLSRPID